EDAADALALLGRGRCRLARKDVGRGLDDLGASLRLRPDLFAAVAAELRPLVKERPDLAAALGAAGDAASVRAVLARLRVGGSPRWWRRAATLPTRRSPGLRDAPLPSASQRARPLRRAPSAPARRSRAASASPAHAASTTSRPSSRASRANAAPDASTAKNL